MKEVFSALIGASLIVFLFLGYVVVTKTWKAMSQLTMALNKIPDLITSFDRAVLSMQEVSAEINILRGLLTPAEQTQTEEPTSPPRMRQRTPFPAPLYEQFKPVTSEATVEETEIVETTDAELAEAEALEVVREHGFEADPDGNPPGVVVTIK